MNRPLIALAGVLIILLGIWRLTQFEPSQTPTVEQLLGDADLAEIRRTRSALKADPDALLLLIIRDEGAIDRERIANLASRLRRLDGVAQVGVPGFPHKVEPSPSATAANRFDSTPPLSDERTVLLVATLAPDAGQLSGAQRLAADATALAQQWAHPGERILRVGSAFVRAHTWAMAEQDMRRQIPLLVAALALLPWLFFGSLRAALPPLLVAVVSTVLTLELARLWGLQLNALLMLIVPFVWAVSTLNMFHLYDRMHARRQAGTCRPVDAARAELFLPCLLTSLTTAGGCAVLAFQERSPLLQAFGTWAAVGTGIAFVTSFAAVGLLAAAPRGPYPPAWPRNTGLRFVGLAQRHAGKVLLLWAVLLAAGATAAFRISTAVPYPQVFADDVPLGDELREASMRIGTDLSPLDLYLEASDEQGQRPGALLSAALALAHYAKDLDETRFVLPVDFLDRLPVPASGTIPAAVDPMGHLDRLAVALAGDERLRDWLSLQRGTARLQLHLQATTVARKQQIVEWLRHFDRTMLGHHRLVIGGPGYLYFRLEQEGLGAALTGAVLSLLVVAAVLAWAFGWRARFWMALIGNLAPLVVVAGLMGALTIPWSMALLPVPAVLLALGVDDTIHLLWPSRTRGRCIESGLLRGARRSGTPLLATTAVLCACLATLGLSGLQANRDIALLLPAGLLSALACDLTLLPALLTVWSRRSSRSSR